MYKIFINGTPLLLTDTLTDPAVVDTLKNFPENTLLLNWDEIPEIVLYAIEVLEKNNELDYVILFGEDLEKLKKIFWSYYTSVIAAGGAVLNEQDEILMIFRKSKWDLPKGKTHEGEKLEETALREVKEETGLKNISVIKPLVTTYHTYSQDGKRILKTNAWFVMKARQPLNFILQKEEGITDAKWVSMADINKYIENSHQSITDVVSHL